MFKLLMLIAFAVALMVSPAVAKPQVLVDYSYYPGYAYSSPVAYSYYPYAYAYSYPLAYY
ncbi:hypothetical protein SFRURICE_019801 [Spodoptera frugiperda]|nr:hypothetical protein SFRURICE_019801 [Spodoptera frugiperda]